MVFVQFKFRGAQDYIMVPPYSLMAPFNVFTVLQLILNVTAYVLRNFSVRLCN